MTSIAKIQQVLDAGLLPTIQAVHSKPEFALANTFTRIEKMGRGASITVMAKIQSGFPESLKEIRKQFGDAVKLNIIDRRIPKATTMTSGWQYADIFKSVGNYDHIKQRLSAALEQGRAAGITKTRKCAKPWPGGCREPAARPWPLRKVNGRVAARPFCAH